MHHQVVVLAAADRPRRARGARAGDHLHEIEVDDLRARSRLVDGRRAELRELLPAHSPPTTCGVTRWKRLRVLDRGVAGRPAGVVAAPGGQRVVVGGERRLCAHLRHRSALLLDHGGDVEEDRRREVAELRLVRLEEQELGRLERAAEGACGPCAGGQSARPLDRDVRLRVIRVERIAVGVREQHVRCEVADPRGERRKPGPVDLERVVAEVEALERRAERRRGPLRLARTDLLDACDGHAGLFQSSPDSPCSP